MKKWVGIALAACLLLSGCKAEAGEQNVPQNVEGPETPVRVIAVPTDVINWKQAYIDFLTDLCKREAAVRNIDRPDYDPNMYAYEVGTLSEGYCLYDIDKDGTPEMFIRYGNCEAAYHTEVYTYREGIAFKIGEFSSGHSSLYTWPGENAVAYHWSHMNGHFVDKISIQNGTIVQETVFDEAYFEGPGGEYTAIEDIVPGSMYLQEVRTTLGMIYGAFHSGTDKALTLPIDDYGRERIKHDIDLDRDRVARQTIEAVLRNSKRLYGVSSDLFGGDTGEMTLEEYLAPGGVDQYAKIPQTLEKLAWVDIDWDGQTECLLRLTDENGWPDQYVILSEQEGTVYAYCINYKGDDVVHTDGVFYDAEYGDSFAVSFQGGQCYQYTAFYDGTSPEVSWEIF